MLAPTCARSSRRGHDGGVVTHDQNRLFLTFGPHRRVNEGRVQQNRLGLQPLPRPLTHFVADSSAALLVDARCSARNACPEIAEVACTNEAKIRLAGADALRYRQHRRTVRAPDDGSTTTPPGQGDGPRQAFPGADILYRCSSRASPHKLALVPSHHTTAPTSRSSSASISTTSSLRAAAAEAAVAPPSVRTTVGGYRPAGLGLARVEEDLAGQTAVTPEPGFLIAVALRRRCFHQRVEGLCGRLVGSARDHGGHDGPSCRGERQVEGMRGALIRSTAQLLPSEA